MFVKIAFSCILLTAVAAPAIGQSSRELRRAADAAIVSDIARERQAERDAQRQPYGSPGHGHVTTVGAARAACSAKAREEAGYGATIVGRPRASSMSTGWEVEGEVRIKGESQPVPFVCSVRNGSVSGILLDPDR
jgi:hypothetical protein